MTNKEKALQLASLKEVPDDEERYFNPFSCKVYDKCLEMAEWKDKNPSVETIKKIVVYALRRTNIMLADDLENEVEWELLIKNALNEN